MVAYKREEMVGITDLSKSLGKYLDKIISGSFKKIAIVRRNEPEAVIVPIVEYEHMKAVVDYFEDKEIIETLKKRVLDRKKPAKMISMDEMEKYLKNRRAE